MEKDFCEHITDNYQSGIFNKDDPD